MVHEQLGEVLSVKLDDEQTGRGNPRVTYSSNMVHVTGISLRQPNQEKQRNPTPSFGSCLIIAKSALLCPRVDSSTK
eukprot:scaffold13399_cov215-Alexandrium_tamarense.AAC.4